MLRATAPAFKITKVMAAPRQGIAAHPPCRAATPVFPADYRAVWAKPSSADGCLVIALRATQPRDHMHTPGQQLRSLREQLGLTMRDVEVATTRLAAKHSNDDFSIAL